MDRHRRRTLLILAVGLLGLLSVSAKGPSVTVEGDGTLSTSAGGWGCGCGPIYRARTAGGAAGLRIAQRSDPRDEGLSVELRGALERESTGYAGGGNCDGSYNDNGITPWCVPPSQAIQVPDHTFGAGEIRVGFAPIPSAHVAGTYEPRLTLGVLLYGGSDLVGGPPNPVVTMAWPTAELSVPVGRDLSAVGGTGSPFVSTLRRPGLAYAGLRYAPSTGTEIESVAGWFRAGVVDQYYQGSEGTPYGGGPPVARGATPSGVTASLNAALAGDPSLMVLSQGALHLGGGVSALAGVGIGAPINVISGRGPDASASLGLRAQF